MGTNIIIISFTEQGSRENAALRRRLPAWGYTCESYAVKRFAEKEGLLPMPEDLQEWIGSRWGKALFLFIGAAGIAVRMIAPWVKDKFTDSAVLVMDEQAGYVIPLLSGHMGGGVRAAKDIAASTGAVPVITTATDVQGKFAVDVFARENGLKITDRVLAKEISAAVLEGKQVGFYSGVPVEGDVPGELSLCRTEAELDQYPYGIAVSGGGKRPGRDNCGRGGKSGGERHGGCRVLYLVPSLYVAGVGCRRGISLEKLQGELEKVWKEQGVERESIGAFASIDLKKEEEGLLCLAKLYGVPFLTFPAEVLKSTGPVSCGSEFVASVTGVDNVCERAAMACCPEGELFLPKQKLDQVTVAVVRKKIWVRF